MTDLPPELQALIAAAAHHLAARYPDRWPWWTPEQLLQRNTLELLKAFVEAEAELDRYHARFGLLPANE